MRGGEICALVVDLHGVRIDAVGCGINLLGGFNDVACEVNIVAPDVVMVEPQFDF